MSRDMLHMDEIKSLVREAYRGIDADTSHVAAELYDQKQLALVPESARSGALGVGNHLRHADIKPGEVILDLGCGAGIDSVIAAHETGPTGRVIGLDFLPEMLQKTERAAVEAGLDNISTLEGEMESIPLPDDSVDHVISNGVINLSARKMRVLSECARVLRTEGRLCVSDLTIEEKSLPPEVLTHPAAWAG
jgi:SAM-dependent methyltransferase